MSVQSNIKQSMKSGVSTNNENTPLYDKRELINDQPNTKCAKPTLTILSNAQDSSHNEQ